jgi:energy-coupling factor transporter ATP-binding protein EcfA2
MRIKTLSFEDKSRNWHFDSLSFNDKLTLLVGASGVGKTQILNAIKKLKRIAKGESFNGLKWSVVFETIDEEEYVWSGEFGSRNEIQLDDIASEKKDKYAFLQEKLWKEDNLLIDRSPETIFFNGNQIVKLPSEQSVVALLKEEPVVSPVFDGFAKIGELVFNTKSVSLTILGKSLLEPLLLHFKSVDEIRHSGLGTEIKLCLLYYTDKNEFKKTQSRFINIFPQVEQIKVEVVPGISSDAIGDYPVIQLKEKGVKDWILQPMISSGMLKSLLQVAELYLCEDGAVILIDEFENSLGVNCMDELTEDLVASERDVQFIITSHHPYIINNIPYRNWKIVTRKAGTVVVKNASDYKIGQSKHDAFIQLLQLDEFTEGVE